MGRARISISCITKFRTNVIEAQKYATSLKSAVLFVESIVQNVNDEIEYLIECEKNCNIALQTANEKQRVLQSILCKLQCILAVTPQTIMVSKPCGTDDEGNTIYQEVEEPNPEYYALLNQISGIEAKISKLNTLTNELQEKIQQLFGAKQTYQDAVTYLNKGKKEIIFCCDNISKKTNIASSQLQKAIVAIKKYLVETVHTDPVPSYTSINWDTYSVSESSESDSNDYSYEYNPQEDSLDSLEQNSFGVENIESIEQWICDVNPNYYNKSLPNQKDYHVNCGSCAFAVENRLNGNNRNIQASNTNIPTDQMMEQVTGKKCKYMSVNEISKRLKKAGAGSHLIVGINRKPVIIGGKKIPQSGHWFNVYYDGDSIYTIEGQSGNIYGWPHDYGDISEWCALI